MGIRRFQNGFPSIFCGRAVKSKSRLRYIPDIRKALKPHAGMDEKIKT